MAELSDAFIHEDVAPNAIPGEGVALRICVDDEVWLDALPASDPGSASLFSLFKAPLFAETHCHRSSREPATVALSLHYFLAGYPLPSLGH